MKIRCTVLLLLCLFFSSCGGEERRQLNDHNRQAAHLIREQVRAQPPALDAIDRTAHDIELNAEEIAKGIGVPKEPIPYSPKASAELRAVHSQKIENGFLGGIIMDVALELLNSFAPWLTGLGGIAVGLFNYFKKIKSDKKVSAMYDGAQGILKRIKNGETMTIKNAKESFRLAQIGWNIYPEIRKDLQDLWDSKKLSKVQEE